MKDAVLRLVRHRLERAREALKDGQLLLAQGSLTSAINRFYYAACYGARALLATREVDSSLCPSPQLFGIYLSSFRTGLC